MKIIIFGDSITYGKRDPDGWRVHHLRMRIDTEHNIPKQENIQVYNLWIPWELSITMLKRFENELIRRIEVKEWKQEKSIVIIAVWINDANGSNRVSDQKTDTKIFQKNIQTLIKEAKKYTNQISILGLTPINEEKLHARRSEHKIGSFLNTDISHYNDLIQEVTQSQEVPFIDIFSSLIKDKWFMNDMTDGIHPWSLWHQKLYTTINQHIVDTYNI